MAEIGYEPTFALSNGQVIPCVGLATTHIAPDKMHDTIMTATHLGYRHIDCASNYGNQSQVGEVLSELIHVGKEHHGRSDFFVTSKIWNTNHRVRHCIAEAENSLRQLKIHHFDLLLIHWPLSFAHGSVDIPKDAAGHVIQDKQVNFIETWRTLEHLYHDGKARAIGVSNFTLEQLRELMAHCEVTPHVVQMECHPYLPQNDIIDFCRSHGIHVTAFAPFGNVTAKDEPNMMQDPVVMSCAKKWTKSPAQIITRWHLQRKCSVVPQIFSAEHMKENISVFDFELDDADMKTLDGLSSKTHRYVSAKKEFGIKLFADEK